MAESIAQPNALNLTGNVAENWRYFKQEFELYLVAAGLDTKPAAGGVSIPLGSGRGGSHHTFRLYPLLGVQNGSHHSASAVTHPQNCN